MRQREYHNPVSWSMDHLANANTAEVRAMALMMAAALQSGALVSLFLDRMISDGYVPEAPPDVSQGNAEGDNTPSVVSHPPYVSRGGG